MVSSERSSSSNTAILPAFAPVELHSCISWDSSFKAVREEGRCWGFLQMHTLFPSWMFYPVLSTCSSRSRLFLSRLEYFKWISLLDINMLYPLRHYNTLSFSSKHKLLHKCKAWNAAGIQFVTWALQAAMGLSRCIQPWFTDLCHWGRWVMSHVPIHGSCYN